MKKLERALLVAEKAHSNQSYDLFPYMYHIKSVVNVAKELGYDEQIQVACALHDTIEDTELSYKDIKNTFGETVAEIVYCVTDELGRNRKERKHKTYPKIRENWKATAVKLCDRIANMRHSKSFSPSLFDMYVKEAPEFIMALKNPMHPDDIERGWEELHNLMLHAVES